MSRALDVLGSLPPRVVVDGREVFVQLFAVGDRALLERSQVERLPLLTTNQLI